VGRSKWTMHVVRVVCEALVLELHCIGCMQQRNRAGQVVSGCMGDMVLNE
jgi:hypothetical protein